MKKIFKYSPTNRTGFEVVDVADDHELQKDELLELPNPVHTPMVLDSEGHLVSNSLEESNNKANEYLESVGYPRNDTPTDGETFQAQMLVQMANMQQAITDLQNQVGGAK